jgi:hypothetical protein
METTLSWDAALPGSTQTLFLMAPKGCKEGAPAGVKYFPRIAPGFWLFRARAFLFKGNLIRQGILHDSGSRLRGA